MMHSQEHFPAVNADSSENITYNHPLFPVYARYRFLSSYPDFSAISHWHKDLEFVLVKKGKLTYNVNGKLIDLNGQSGIMVNSRQLHYGFSAERKECEFICILLSPELLWGNRWFYQNFIERITENPGYPYLYLDREGWKSDVLEKLEHLYCSYGSGSVEGSSCFQVMEDFISIMKILYGNLDVRRPGEIKESSEIIALRDMIAYVEEYFREQITLEQIALAGACCKSRCLLLFKKYLKETPIAYVTKLRLKKSLAMLLDSDRTITDIAYECGFCGASYYCETFRKYYGASPLKYRKMQLEAAPWTGAVRRQLPGQP